MILFPDMMTRRLIVALVAVSGAFILWLVPSFVVMAPDQNYTEQMLREAELVAASVARGGLASRPPSRVGGNPRDPRTIEARNRSPFHLRRAEGIVRHMQSITMKRIVLYDHRGNIVMDSYNFTRAQDVTTQDLPPPENPFVNGRASQAGFLPAQSTAQQDIDSFYLRPPRGKSAFVQAALKGQSQVRKIFHEQNSSRRNVNNEFRPKQTVLQAFAPVRRLKLVQGAVVLIDSGGADRRAWRWRALIDSAPVFAAFVVALILLLLWLKSAMLRPIARLAYGTQELETAAPSRRTKRSDEIDMISRRHQAAQIAALNFAEASRAQNQGDQLQLKDSKMASLIHVALINTKMETVDLSLIVQRCIHQQNMRAQKSARDKMRSTNSHDILPFGDRVILEKVETGQIRNAFHLPIFSDALALMLDYIIQGTAASAPQGWPDCVRVALIRQRRTIRLLIEDDGPDLAAYDLTSWTARAYDLAQPPVYTQRALETCIAMHHGRFVVRSLRPACIALILPLPNQKSRS